MKTQSLFLGGAMPKLLISICVFFMLCLVSGPAVAALENNARELEKRIAAEKALEEQMEKALILRVPVKILTGQKKN